MRNFLAFIHKKRLNSNERLPLFQAAGSERKGMKAL